MKSEAHMDQVVPAIRTRTLLRNEEPTQTPSHTPPVRLTRTIEPVVMRVSVRSACVGACDTPVDPLQLVWMIGRDREDFVNF